MIKIVVKGASGRMGTLILARARDDKDFALVESVDSADVLIDFSHPDATLPNLEEAARAKKAAVVGTTGHTVEQRRSIERLSTKLPFVLSPNMSTGANLAFSLLGEAARVLGKGFEVRMTEVHHIHKKDKPSGTALKMAEVIAGPLGIDPATIPIQSIRKGEVVGDHTVLFDSASETLEITHRALSRDTFALGALRAAQWIVGKPAGIYSMADVLGLKF